MSLVSLEQPSHSGKRTAAHLQVTCCSYAACVTHEGHANMTSSNFLQTVQHDSCHSFALLQTLHVSTSLSFGLPHALCLSSS